MPLRRRRQNKENNIVNAKVTNNKLTKTVSASFEFGVERFERHAVKPFFNNTQWPTPSGAKAAARDRR